jgi:phenylalanyl-tRNA synthetase beta chain
MLVSKQLLSKFLPKIHATDNKDIVNACSAIGVEVEQILTHPITNNLVIGQIIEVTDHPNADKLHVCKVKINDKDINTIVCGANNVATGKKVIVALQNAKLHDGRIIEYKELRSVSSQGMICAYSELTPHASFESDEDKDGIILLDDAVVGDKDVGKYIGLNDTLFELTLPSNRNDLNGVLFLCQELSGFFK